MTTSTPTVEPGHRPPPLQPVRRSADSVAAQFRAERLATLDAQALRWIAEQELAETRGRKANLELGRVFREIQGFLGHGKWERHFAEKFAPRGISPRTARRYMAMARTSDAAISKIIDSSKSAKSAEFPLATDPEAVSRRKATAEAQAEIGNVAHPRAPKVFRLSLAVAVSREREWRRMNEFWKSGHRARVEKEMLAVFERGFKQFKVKSDQDKELS